MASLIKEAEIQLAATPDMVSYAVRRAITQGLLKAGQPLVQNEIAKQFGVSSIPVREALRQLEAEGIVVFQRNRGFTVASLSPENVREVYEMRGALETLALRLAVPKMTEKDFQAAEQVIARYQRETEISNWGALNWEYHSVLYRAAERPMLLKSIQTLHNNADRYFSSDPLLMEYRSRIEQEHQQILEACRAREIMAAVRRLSEHITHASSQLIAYLERGA